MHYIRDSRKDGLVEPLTGTSFFQLLLDQNKCKKIAQAIVVTTGHELTITKQMTDVDYFAAVV